MTTYVLGLDPALRRTGVAAIEYHAGACAARTWVLATSPPGDDSVTSRLAGIRSMSHQLDRLLAALGTPALSLLEGPSYGSAGGSGHERAGVWWAFAHSLVAAGSPIAECAPPTLKKWSTGNGRADKPDVVAAMRTVWPGVACTDSAFRHHECEALALATMCAQAKGWPVPVRRGQGDSLAVIRWPSNGGIVNV